MNTTTEYNTVIDFCKDLFINKSKDYGTSWRIMRLSSITDQLYIKAKRIRTLETTGVSKVGDDISGEFVAIVNYCVIALIQAELGEDGEENIPVNVVENYYNQKITETRDLMFAKNHDYGEAWRDMRISSITDMILMKLHRVKQIENNGGKTIVSEGLTANYQDMLNYAIFALIKLGFAEQK